MTSRRAARAALLTGLLAVLSGPAARGQKEKAPDAAPDKIVFIDRKANKTESRDAELKESGGAYTVVIGKTVIPVSPADIVRVIPGDVAGVPRGDVLAAVALEDKRDYEPARNQYRAMEKKATKDAGKQFAGFKTAMLTARLADDGKDTPEAAATALGAYLSVYAKGWEVWPATRTLARFQLEGSRPAEGQKSVGDPARTWANAAKNPTLPQELRDEATLQEIDALIRTGQFAAAAAQAAAAKSVATGPGKERLAILEAGAKAGANPTPEVVAAVQKMIADSKDPMVRATGHGVLGELFLAADKPREAMWEFLWVETVYDQNPDERLKAVWRLETVFRKLGEADRADAYKDKLKRMKLAL